MGTFQTYDNNWLYLSLNDGLLRKYDCASKTIHLGLSSGKLMLVLVN